jgi:hypothetical protein
MHSFARFKKSRRKITVAFTHQAGTVLAVAVVLACQHHSFQIAFII